ncbi:MAG: hypothetical protein J07HR59_01667 [Halorubrum sp. J07HR59]|nr:MAG: hypothetical protein J07HR59_01667 [Halorubrum sp. J07HR59]
MSPQGGRAGPSQTSPGNQESSPASGAEELDPRPSVLAFGVVLTTGAVAVGALAAGATQGAAAGTVGLIVLLGGMYRVSPRVIGLGGGFVGAGVAIAGVLGSPPAPLVLAAVAGVVAWDVADHAASVSLHVGRTARSRRNLVFHTSSSVLVGGITSGFAYGVYLTAAGGQPVAAVVFLLAGAVLLVSVLR